MNYLKEVARVGSISAASIYLNITPQALSSSIKTLERELGFAVLIRSNQGVALTEEGLRLLACANQFFDEVDSIRLNKDKVKKQVCIHITQEASDYFALPLIKELSEADNELSLAVKIEPIAQLKQKIQTGEIDSYFSVAPEYEGTFFSDNSQPTAEQNALEHIALGPIASLHCLVPKSVAIHDYKRVSLKTATAYPCLFRETAFEDVASIAHILNEISPIADYQMIPNPIQYKVNLLLGERISFDFLSDYSEWRAYASLLNVIPLKERLNLHVCLMTRQDTTRSDAMALFKNTCFEKEEYVRL